MLLYVLNMEHHLYGMKMNTRGMNWCKNKCGHVFAYVSLTKIYSKSKTKITYICTFVVHICHHGWNLHPSSHYWRTVVMEGK